MEQGLLDALREAPDDLLNHLVYADWLDDHGQPGRAAYVREWVDLERLPPAARPARHAELAKRCRDLHATWLGPLPASVNGWAFAGGVVARLNFTADITPDVASLLQRFAVREAHLYRTPTVQLAAALPALANLRELVLPTRPNEDWLCSSLLPPLRRLCLSRGLNTALARLLARTPRLASLRCLEADGVTLDDAGAVSLLRGRHLRGLRRWHVQGGRVTGMSLWHLFAGGRAARWQGLTYSVRLGTLADLAPIGRCQNLEALRVTLPAHADTDPHVGFLGPLDRLRDLHLEGHVSPGLIRWLAGWPGLVNLARLSLPTAQHLGPGLVPLLESPYRNSDTLFDLPGVAV